MGTNNNYYVEPGVAHLDSTALSKK